MISYKHVIAGAIFPLALVACGGGGGSPGSTAGVTSTPSTTTTTATTAATAPAVTASVVNASGAQVTSIAIGGGYFARATVRDASGAQVANKLVTFALNGTSVASITPATALTDASGVAQVAIAPTSASSLGAATLTASAVFGAATVSGTSDFSVSASNLTLSPLSVGSTSLASGANTPLSVTALIGGTAASSTQINVTFSTTCGRISGTTRSFGTTTNGSGVASAVYTAVEPDGTLCSGPVTITAASSGASSSVVTVTVAAATADAVTFVSATPAQIFVSGAGALEQSVLKFKALAGNTPMQNQQVRFSLLVNPGGVGLNGAGQTGDALATTDSAGEATVSVFSGTIPGPVRVRAALVSTPTVFAESQYLTVASGPPSQRFMSLSVETFNIEAASRDGTTTNLTARLADRQGNPVEDGTVVNFTTEGGQVASSCATARVNNISSCSVVLASQNPRPADGRISVLAYTNGTKDYVDANGNNRFDAGDTLSDIGDAYRDDNENATYDNVAGEFVVPRGGAQACAGRGWPFPSRVDTCDGQLATTVRQQAVLYFSSSTPVLTIVSTTSALVEFTLASQGNTLLPMPAGTTVAAATQDTTPGNGVACAVDLLVGSTVPNVAPRATGVTAATAHSVSLKDCAAGDRLVVTVTVPSGLATVLTPIPLP